VFAAGVSSAAGTSENEFDREAKLLYPAVRDCRARGRMIVYFSTASAGMYGGDGSSGREGDPVYPGTSYGRHKLAMESVLAASGAKHLVVRLAHALGPGQPAHQLLPSLAVQIGSGRVSVYRGARRDLIDIADVVTIIDGLLTAGVSGEVVNVATGFSVPVEELVDHLEHRLAPRRPVVRDYLDRPSAHEVSTEKLIRLVPAVSRMRFGPDYFRAAVDRCLDVPAVPGPPGSDR
jgi:nucleoside-diphosphate-sugar epimerase